MPVGYDHVLTCRCYYWDSRHILIDLSLWQGSLWDKPWTEPLQSASSYQRATPTTLGHPSRIHVLPPSRALPHPLQTRTKGRTRPRRRQKPMGMLTSRLRRLRLALHRLGMSRLMQLILPSHLRHCTLEDLQVVTWHARTHTRTQHNYDPVLCCAVCRACLKLICWLHAATYLLPPQICPGRHVTHHVKLVCHAKMQPGQRCRV